MLSAIEIDGRPAVLFVDVPAGARTELVDASAIVLEEGTSGPDA
jgi:hypothetical protein